MCRVPFSLASHRPSHRTMISPPGNAGLSLVQPSQPRTRPANQSASWPVYPTAPSQPPVRGEITISLGPSLQTVDKQGICGWETDMPSSITPPQWRWPSCAVTPRAWSGCPPTPAPPTPTGWRRSLRNVKYQDQPHSFLTRSLGPCPPCCPPPSSHSPPWTSPCLRFSASSVINAKLKKLKLKTTYFSLWQDLVHEAKLKKIK